jgi:DNA mismatch endonuclease, patch repair protein
MHVKTRLPDTHRHLAAGCDIYGHWRSGMRLMTTSQGTSGCSSVSTSETAHEWTSSMSSTHHQGADDRGTCSRTSSFSMRSRRPISGEILPNSSGRTNLASKRTKHRQTSRPEASSLHVRRRMQATPQRDTPCELAIRSALHQLGMRFRVDWPVPGTRRRADMTFVAAKVVVFVDGCFWHGCPIHATWPKANARWWRDKIETNQRRDHDTNAFLSTNGWRVMRFWEHADSRRAALAIAKVVKLRAASNE